MDDFINKLWTSINIEKPVFSEKDFFQFHQDFGKMADSFGHQYLSSSNLQKMVIENQIVFEKLADILVYEPNFFASRFIQDRLFLVFETGKMPRAGIFAQYLPWSVEKVAALTPLYVADAQMRIWIAQNWNVCQKYRFNILWGLHDEHIKDAELFKIYNPHFLRKFAFFVIVSALMCFLYFNAYIPDVLLTLVELLLSYWILSEFFFALLCCSIKAFW